MQPGDLAETHRVAPPRLPTIAFGALRIGDLVWLESTGEPCLVMGLAEDPTYVHILRGGELRSIHLAWLSKYATAG